MGTVYRLNAVNIVSVGAKAFFLFIFFFQLLDVIFFSFFALIGIHLSVIMKIVLLGLIVLALTDGIVAAPRDNDNHLVKKLEAESETIPAQLQQLQTQLNDQQQQIKEQQHQIKEQQHRMEVQQQRNEEQQRQMKAFMQINRARQSDTVTGVSQCAVGTYSTTQVIITHFE